ncbi:uncharacterized protein LOC142171676 [Nicotiana tabacum]|uniref:Uncharacterized protein LOC142171676 n=1 Tax=Nicotiana tabacum TaxID=4097 RepID=A0AC58T2L5_TOBAC
MYKLAKIRERKAQDLDRVRCIKDEDGKVLVEEACIRRRWHEYFHRLLNEEGDRNIMMGELENSESLRDFGFYRHIRYGEVDVAIRKMSRGKATGPDEILVEFWKEAGRVGLECLTSLFNVIFKTKKMPEDWRWSLMILLYKNKGEIQNCNNYRGIKLPSHTMKGEEKDLHMVFIDLEKAYDKVPREVLWRQWFNHDTEVIHQKGGVNTPEAEERALNLWECNQKQ